ncbi:hypothetical protein [Streptomyces albidus (ex Kaewkla and Franco 2022)]|nr:hypothetical protein [Streptomyces albidus (ex Kaewkla and Franco 2022)]
MPISTHRTPAVAAVLGGSGPVLGRGGGIGLIGAWSAGAVRFQA